MIYSLPFVALVPISVSVPQPVSCCTTQKVAVSCLMRFLCFVSLCLVWVMFALIILMTVWCAVSTRTHALRKQVREAFSCPFFPPFISRFPFFICQKVPVEDASQGNYESVAVRVVFGFFFFRIFHGAPFARLCKAGPEKSFCIRPKSCPSFRS